ncbi:DUF2244 domain-containing protein [Marinobacter sp.]|uniref:DUF2244 domain-containing protein n=1 Tax=Marinobacter sp. TaxID=50741 RepID=UPI002B459CBA|nr:DUF2244 domain-containing protein [Marinobacter sp.]HKK56012.1 DUF2244 domain-containing protein [Marinobacter sp.]
MVEELSAEEGRRYLLTPNRSMSWGGNVRVWLALLALTAFVATGMSLMGAWVVLPFAGIELAALAGAFYYTSRKCQRKEVLVLTPSIIRLEKGATQKEVEWDLPKQFVRVYQNLAPHPFTPPKLYFKFRDDEIPLAHFLNIEDTRILISILQQYGIPIQKREVQEPISFWR